MAKILGDADVLFLGNHGVITAVPTVAQAFDDLYFVERAAQTHILSWSKGGRLSRSWFDKALLSVAEGLTTNSLTLNCPALSW